MMQFHNIGNYVNHKKWETVFMNKTNNDPDFSLGCKLSLKYHVEVLYCADCK